MPQPHHAVLTLLVPPPLPLAPAIHMRGGEGAGVVLKERCCGGGVQGGQVGRARARKLPPCARGARQGMGKAIAAGCLRKGDGVCGGRAEARLG